MPHRACDRVTLTGMTNTPPDKVPTYEDCIDKAARVYADWLAERER